MEKIGILSGQEGSFPQDLINRIKNLSKDECQATQIKPRTLRIEEMTDFKVIVDRLSHKVEFFRPYLKKMSLSGCQVINNPFWWGDEDRYFNLSMASMLGIKVPKTALLPSPGENGGEDSMDLFLKTPVNWGEIIDYLGGFPVILKPYKRGAENHLYVVNSFEELAKVYEMNKETVLIAQEYVRFDLFVRTFVAGKENILPAIFDPIKRNYLISKGELTREQGRVIIEQALILSEKLKYDMNVIDFAICKDQIYAIDFINPMIASRPAELPPFYYEWILDNLAKTVISYCQGTKK